MPTWLIWTLMLLEAIKDLLKLAIKFIREIRKSAEELDKLETHTDRLIKLFKHK